MSELKSAPEKTEKNTAPEKKPEAKEELIAKKNSNLTFIVLTVVLVGLLLGLIFVPKLIHKAVVDNNKYNNFEFYKGSDNFWYTIVQKGAQPYQIPFYYHPRDLVNITVDPGIRDKFFEIMANNGSIYITLDPDSTDNSIVVAGVEIAKITGKGYSLLNVPTHSAFTKQPANISTNVETPIVTCSNSNNKTMVIWITLSNKNMAYSYDYCIRLEAKSYGDTIKVADRLMYDLLGIMN
jgi:hypothetical protein